MNGVFIAWIIYGISCSMNFTIYNPLKNPLSISTASIDNFNFAFSISETVNLPISESLNIGSNPKVNACSSTISIDKIW